MSDKIDPDDARTMLAFVSQNLSKQIKVANDGLVSMLNNDESQNLKSEDEHELAQQAYQDTVSAVEALYELTESLDSTDKDEMGVSEQFNPAVQTEVEDDSVGSSVEDSDTTKSGTSQAARGSDSE